MFGRSQVESETNESAKNEERGGTEIKNESDNNNNNSNSNTNSGEGVNSSNNTQQNVQKEVTQQQEVKSTKKQFSFIKKGKKANEPGNTNTQNDNSDLSKLMAATASSSSNNTNTNNITLSNISNTSNTNHSTSNTTKKTKFSFIKKTKPSSDENIQNTTTTPSNTEHQQQQQNTPHENKDTPTSSQHEPEVQINTETSQPTPSSPSTTTNPTITPPQPKTLSDIKNLYTTEKSTYFSKTFDYIEDFKNFIRNINRIRTEITTLTTKQTTLQSTITSLQQKQNSLIEENDFDSAMKLEDNLNTLSSEIKSLSLTIQHKTESDFLNLYRSLPSFLTQRNNHYSLYLSLFPQIPPLAKDASRLLQEEAIATYVAIEEDIASSERIANEIKDEYTLSTNTLNEMEEQITQQFTDETKDMDNEIETLNNERICILEEIETIKEQLRIKNEKLNEIDNTINTINTNKDNIRLKYKNNETYITALNINETKQKKYNEALLLNEHHKRILTEKQQLYQSKQDELSTIITSIETKCKAFPSKTQLNVDISAQLSTLFEQDERNYKSIHDNESQIEELLLKVNDNNEKIEVLDLQNKRISSEIVSVDSNIANLEDIKKSQVMKKQFKDAQNTNNEIKKCKESKQSITELLNGNKDEIELLMNENTAHNEVVMKLKKENENMKNDINNNEEVYAKRYYDMLKEFKEEMEEDEKKDEEMIQMVNEEMEVVKGKFKVEEEIKEVNEDDKVNEVCKEEETTTTTATTTTTTVVNSITTTTEETKEEKINTLNKQIQELEVQLNQATDIEDYEAADEINTKLEELKSTLETLLSSE